MRKRERGTGGEDPFFVKDLERAAQQITFNVGPEKTHQS